MPVLFHLRSPVDTYIFFLYLVLGENNLTKAKRSWEGLEIRSLVEKDRATLFSMLIRTRSFTPEEIEVAMELIDIVLKDPNQKDYRIHCRVDEQDRTIGFICYGPTPMTQGTFDLYWIAVDPDFQETRGGFNPFSFLGRDGESEGRSDDSCGYFDDPSLREDAKILSEEWISRGGESLRLLSSW